MNKKATIITYLPFKKYLIFYLLIFVAILGYFTLYPEIRNIEVSCDEIIPNRLNLKCGEDRCTDILNNQYYWADGTPLYFPYFSKGDEEGENINYMYAKSVLYYKKPIDSNGLVGREIRLSVDMIIDPNDKTQEGYKVVGHKCRRS